MSIETRIYAGGAFAFGKEVAVNDILSAGYSAVIIWSVHVKKDGTLILNNTQMVSNGIYKEAETMNLPNRLAQIHKTGVKIIFSVGAGGTQDFENIGKLMNGTVPGAGNPLYDNFKALKDAMVFAGGDIDAIDFDNEDDIRSDIMVNFGSMLADIGYESVTLCPYNSYSVWTDTYHRLLDRHGKSFVSAIHLQCYSGGRFNSPEPWGRMIAAANGNTDLIPGLATNQAAAGPWWYSDLPGRSVVETQSVAMNKDADWSNMLRVGHYKNADEAMEDVKGGETFFFFCRANLDLGSGKQFKAGDAVFFGGRPSWGSAPQCDAYTLSGACVNTYNFKGACPSDLEEQYAEWKQDENSPTGGFVWLYDSMINCLLSNCCGTKNASSADVAKAYQQAIINGLS